MPNLVISGYSDDIVDFEGVISEEFYINGENTWIGELQAPNGDSMEVRVSFYVSNGNGWDVEILDSYFTGAPWVTDKQVRYNDSYDSDEDFYLVLNVPEGTMVREL